MRTFLLAWIATVTAWAQVPQISNVAVTAVSHASAHVTFNINSNAYPQVKFGIVPGTYIYSSASYPSPANLASLSIGGLQPATTYYFRATARPDLDDDANICQTVACGPPEIAITTLPDPPIHPQPPNPAMAWVPSEPNTSGYTVISMQASGVNGECVAAQNVANPGNWTSSVVQGDNISAVLGKINYGTVVETPQGVTCKVYQSESTFHSGYALPALPLDSVAGGNIDSPTHRWIVFRTHQNTPVDFPPYGVRTGPPWAAKMTTYEIQSPGYAALGLNLTGQVFDCYNTRCHHFWFENFAMTSSNAGFVPNQEDPPAATCAIRVEPLFASPAPSYIVLDRLYVHTAAFPARTLCGLYAGGDHAAIMSSYVDLNMWRIGLWPTLPVKSTGKILAIPKSTWAFNALRGTVFGMLSASSVMATGSGTMTGWLDSVNPGENGLTIHYTGLAKVFCVPCTAAAGSETPPPTALKLFQATISSGMATVTWNVSDGFAGDYTTFTTDWKPLGIFLSYGNVRFLDNNYVHAIGQTVYADAVANGTMSDYTFTHNYLDFPVSQMKSSPKWDGYNYTFRNSLEIKQTSRWNVQGNVFNGAAAYQNAGFAVMFPGSYPGNGTQDILFKNNILRHIAAGIGLGGGGSASPPDSPTELRVEISNNLFLDLNRDAYNNGGGGLYSGPLSINPGAEDVNFTRNTIDLTLGSGPGLMLVGGAASGTTVMGEGFAFTNNLAHLSLNALKPVWSLGGQEVPSHPAIPAASTGFDPLTFKQELDADFIRTGATVTPNYTFTHNVLIGAMDHTGQSTYTDMTQATLNSLIPSFPAGNIFPTGATLAARRAAVQWDPVNYRVKATKWNAGDIGADIEAIRAAAGFVQMVRLAPNSTSVQVSYLAPDARTCYVETSPNGSVWTRLPDAGGARPRSVTVTGLPAATSYQYRILCYFTQTAAQEFPADQQTSGTFSTSVATARNVILAVPLASVSGAVTARITLTPAGGGSPIQNLCHASPCTVMASAGTYQREVELLDSQNRAVQPPDIWTITVP